MKLEPLSVGISNLDSLALLILSFAEFVLHFKGPNHDWSRVGLEADQNHYRMKKLKCGSLYLISIQSVNGVGRSDNSNVNEVQTKGGCKYIFPCLNFVINPSRNAYGRRYTTIRIPAYSPTGIWWHQSPLSNLICSKLQKPSHLIHIISGLFTSYDNVDSITITYVVSFQFGTKYSNTYPLQVGRG